MANAHGLPSNSEANFRISSTGFSAEGYQPLSALLRNYCEVSLYAPSIYPFAKSVRFTCSGTATLAG